MSLDPPRVLLERSFLRAISDPDDEHHHEARQLYLELLDQYELEHILLVAVSDHLGTRKVWRREGALAPVDPLHVGFQHRRAARRSELNDDPDFALTLVMCEREKITRVATFDPRFEAFELELVRPV